jgi:SAM-dependent methyltransferase
MINKIDRCDLCGKDVSSSGRVVAKGEFEYYKVKSIVHTVMCKYCKYIFQHEQFDYKTLTHLYEQDSMACSSNTTNKSDVHREYLIKRQKFITESIELVLPPDNKILNILDVGGGDGEITAHLIDRGKIYLTDVSTNDPIHSDIIKVSELFDEADFPVKFDVIIMNHVLEHVFSPMDFLMRANSLLTDNGVIIIEVPFELYTPLFGRIGDWKHVAYFSTSVLRNFLLKAQFNPFHVTLSTGYYGTREIAVIRAVATKVTNPTDPIDCKSGYLQLLFDILNVKALTLYFSNKIRKLLS